MKEKQEERGFCCTATETCTTRDLWQTTCTFSDGGQRFGSRLSDTRLPNILVISACFKSLGARDFGGRS